MKIPKNRFVSLIMLCVAGMLATQSMPGLFAQDTATPDTKNWTTADDHKNMMQQLGIRALRPGPSGREGAPDQANYDEAKANPFPKLPEVLTLKNGKKVTKAKDWWKKRRPEIVEDFEREVLGRIPANVPKVTWSVVKTSEATVGNRPVLGKQLVGHVDNSSYPDITVDIQMILVTPADAKKPVPVMIMFGFGDLPGTPPPPAPKGFAFGPPPAGSDPPATEQLIADGWGYAYVNPSSIQADNGAGLTKGIIGRESPRPGGPCAPGAGEHREPWITWKPTRR